MDPANTKYWCDNILKRYAYDVEGAHVHEDCHVYDTLHNLVVALEATKDLESLEELKAKARKCFDEIAKLRETTQDLKWYA